MEHLIKRLEKSVAFAEKEGENMDDVSWGMQEGILISYNEAKAVIEALKAFKNSSKPVLAVRCYQIDFGNHLRCKIKVTDNGIEVEGAINGWGDGVPLSEVVVVEVK